MDICVLTIVADKNGERYRPNEPVESCMLHHDFKYEVWYDTEAKSWTARTLLRGGVDDIRPRTYDD